MSNEDEEVNIQDDLEDDQIGEEEVEDDEEDLDELGDEEGEIKIENNSFVELGDLKKIERNTLKKKYANIPDISKTILKNYKNIILHEHNEYNYNLNDNMRNDAENLISFEDEMYNYVDRNVNDSDNYVYTLYQLIDNKNKDIKNMLNNNVDLFTICMPEQCENNKFQCTKLIEKPNIVESEEQCKKCGNNKAFTIRKQTRGGDESMTTFCTCSKCGHKWKYS